MTMLPVTHEMRDAAYICCHATVCGGKAIELAFLQTVAVWRKSAPAESWMPSTAPARYRARNELNFSFLVETRCKVSLPGAQRSRAVRPVDDRTPLSHSDPEVEPFLGGPVTPNAVTDDPGHFVDNNDAHILIRSVRGCGGERWA